MRAQKKGEPADSQDITLKYVENALHDIKTPFSIVYSLIQSLERRTDLPADALDQVTQMKQCCYKISKLIQDANDAGKIGRGRFSPRYANYDIVFLTESITRSIAPLAERKAIDIIFDTRTEERVVAVDRQIYERILLNLLSNAIKFSGRGTEIFVNLRCAPKRIILELTDGGIGISEEKLTAVFARYTFADTPENQSGSGIGLDIVAELVDALNGTISARRNKDAPGTTVRLALPAFTVAEDTLDYGAGYAFSNENIFQIGLPAPANK